MFFNEFEVIQSAKDIMNPNHFLFDSFKHPRASLILILSFFSFFFIDYSLHVRKIIVKLCCNTGTKLDSYANIEENFTDDWDFKYHIDEELGSYWKCIPGIE